jgi:hypothetical protein
MIKFKNLLLSCVVILSLTSALHAEAKKYTDAEIAEMINNPLGNLWLLFIQNDTKYFGGDLTDKLNNGDELATNVTLIQPVMPMQLTDNLKLIFRPVIPIVRSDQPAGIDFNGKPTLGESREDILNRSDLEEKTHSGIGDIVLWTALATNDMARPPEVLGFGITTMLDTASRDELGTGKNSVGPMALAVHVGEDWIYGVVAQHWWSFAGDSNRDNVNLSDIQYILRYRYSKDTNIGMAPNIQYNWSSEQHDNRLTLPIGGGVDTMIKLGPLPVKIGVEYYRYVKTPDIYGPKWQVRFYFSPVIPSPGWSKKPLFNF